MCRAASRRKYLSQIILLRWKRREYHVVYRAESATYKTNLGNNTYSEYDVAITSVAGGSTLAKFEDANGVLAEGTSLLAAASRGGAALYLYLLKWRA